MFPHHEKSSPLPSYINISRLRFCFHRAERENSGQECRKCIRERRKTAIVCFTRQQRVPKQNVAELWGIDVLVKAPLSFLFVVFETTRCLGVGFEAIRIGVCSIFPTTTTASWLVAESSKKNPPKGRHFPYPNSFPHCLRVGLRSGEKISSGACCFPFVLGSLLSRSNRCTTLLRKHLFTFLFHKKHFLFFFSFFVIQNHPEFSIFLCILLYFFADFEFLIIFSVNPKVPSTVGFSTRLFIKERALRQRRFFFWPATNTLESFLTFIWFGCVFLFSYFSGLHLFSLEIK